MRDWFLDGGRRETGRVRGVPHAPVFLSKSVQEYENKGDRESKNDDPVSLMCPPSKMHEYQKIETYRICIS